MRSQKKLKLEPLCNQISLNYSLKQQKLAAKNVCQKTKNKMNSTFSEFIKNTFGNQNLKESYTSFLVYHIFIVYSI